jgi:hypothetical protein
MLEGDAERVPPNKGLLLTRGCAARTHAQQKPKSLGGPLGARSCRARRRHGSNGIVP